MIGFKEFVLEELAAPDTMAEYGNDDNTSSFRQNSPKFIIRDKRIVVDKNKRQKDLVKRIGNDNTKDDELTAYDRQNTPT